MLNKQKFVFKAEIKIANTKTPKTMLAGYVASVFPAGHTGVIRCRVKVIHFSTHMSSQSST